MRIEKRPVIAVTLGDPFGIGPEIIIKAALSKNFKSIGRICIVGDITTLRHASSKIGKDLEIACIQTLPPEPCSEYALEVFDLKNVSQKLPLGHPTAEGGNASIEYIKFAIDLAQRGQVDAITTGPINKQAIDLAGYSWPGHTELLADITQTREVALMMVGQSLKIVLVTLHVALQHVASSISQQTVEKTIRLTDKWLRQYAVEKPRIAVLGLNPHCGDGGRFGNEEETVIIPAIGRSHQSGISVEGPFPADAFFGQGHYQSYDAVVAMYHDQGLIPVKMVAGGKAVNITLGLPFLRTSVDHGTAYDIVGKNCASPDSLLEALKMASFLSQTVTVIS